MIAGRDADRVGLIVRLGVHAPAWLAAGTPQMMREDIRAAQYDLRSRIESQILAYLDACHPKTPSDS